MSKHKNTIIGAVIAAVLLALFLMPRFSDPNRGLSAQWEEAGINCMPNGHTNLLQHFHPHLTINVEGRQESIPANTGLTRDCMAEVHTHDATGTLHIESVSGQKQFHLKDFFTVYGQPLDRPGYSVSLMVDGKPNQELGSLILKDKQNIVLEYKSN